MFSHSVKKWDINGTEIVIGLFVEGEKDKLEIPDRVYAYTIVEDEETKTALRKYVKYIKNETLCELLVMISSTPKFSVEFL